MTECCVCAKHRSCCVPEKEKSNTETPSCNPSRLITELWRSVFRRQPSDCQRYFRIRQALLIESAVGRAVLQCVQQLTRSVDTVARRSLLYVELKFRYACDFPDLERAGCRAFRMAQSARASAPVRNRSECLQSIAAGQCMTGAKRP